MSKAPHVFWPVLRTPPPPPPLLDKWAGSTIKRSPPPPIAFGSSWPPVLIFERRKGRKGNTLCALAIGKGERGWRCVISVAHSGFLALPPLYPRALIYWLFRKEEEGIWQTGLCPLSYLAPPISSHDALANLRGGQIGRKGIPPPRLGQTEKKKDSSNETWVLLLTKQKRVFSPSWTLYQVLFPSEWILFLSPPLLTFLLLGDFISQ